MIMISTTNQKEPFTTQTTIADSSPSKSSTNYTNENIKTYSACELSKEKVAQNNQQVSHIIAIRQSIVFANSKTIVKDTKLYNKLQNSSSSSCSRNTRSSNSYVQSFCNRFIQLIISLYNTLRKQYLVTLFLLLLSTTCSLCTASLCNAQSWWDSTRHRCAPCTVCKGDMIPLRPCQIHQDTICGSIYDLKIDWVLLSKTEPNWKERRKYDESDYAFDHHHLTAEQLQQLENDVVPLDWQTAALFLAVLACLLFFIVAACILVHHMRQWRRMERRLDQDVEELSTRLMAKLAEVQSLEGGTFFIGNADALGLTTSTAMTAAAAAATFHHQPQHVKLPEISDKHQERQLLSTIKSGNVYIEENGSKC